MSGGPGPLVLLKSEVELKILSIPSISLDIELNNCR